MANVVYVGNYPNTLTDEEIIDIFKDFEGLVLLRSVKQNRKCYSFILCKNQEQVIEIVLSLNGFDVGGRNLIVRASDDELQEIIDQCDYEEDYSNYQSFADYDKGEDPSHITNSGRIIENDYQTSSKAKYRQPRKPSRLASTSGMIEDNQQFSDSKNCKESASWKGNEIDETTSCYSYSTSIPDGSISPCSVASSFTRRKRKGEKFSFVSIINFPDGSSIEELQELLSDYNPFKIIMQNKISDDDKPTEAIVCFLKAKNATDSILNLDNTLYQGRVLILSECDDITLISDLRKVHCC